MKKNKIEKLNKCERQYREYVNKHKTEDAWRISLKYSKILQKYIAKRNILSRVFDVYELYINELKSNNILMKNKTYIIVWETVLNTINNPKLSDKIKKSSVKQLYYVNVKKNKM